MIRVVAVLVLVFVFIAWVIHRPKSSATEQHSLLHTSSTKLGAALLIIGAVGVLGLAVNRFTTVNWLPDSFEWPLNGQQSVLEFPSGEYAVVHEAAGRIQVYGQSGEFLRGWQLDSRAGGASLKPDSTSSFHVFLPYNKTRYTYDLSGSELPSNYDADSLSEPVDELAKKKFKVSPLLWPFTSFTSSSTIAGLGCVLLVLFGRRRTSR